MLFISLAPMIALMTARQPTVGIAGCRFEKLSLLRQRSISHSSSTSSYLIVGGVCQPPDRILRRTQDCSTPDGPPGYRPDQYGWHRPPDLIGEQLRAEFELISALLREAVIALVDAGQLRTCRYCAQFTGMRNTGLGPSPVSELLRLITNSRRRCIWPSR